MPFITDFDVTYGNALAPAGFHRVTTREGGSANLNAVGSTSQSFLWTHESANRGRPVVEVQVTYDSEPGPPGFERVSRDLAKGGQSGRRAYLWLRRQSTSVAENPSAASRESHGGSLSSSSSSGRTQTSGDGAITSSSRDYVDDQISHTKATPPGPSRGDEDVSAPLVDVVVVFGQESDPNVAEAAEAAEQATTASTPVDKGRKAASRGPQRVWEKLHRSLNPGAMAGDAGDVYLWYRRGSDEDSPHCPSRSFSLGDWVDARDNAGIWRVAQVVSIGAETLRVHFPSKVEEDFAFESPELAKLGTYTPGRDTGQTNRRAGEPWDIAPEQVRDMTRTLKTLCSTILEEESAPKVGGAAVGSGGWRQGRERRFWEVELPAFIERCLSSSITDEEALPPIHELFLLMLEVIAVRMWQPASMPRHLLQTLKRLGQDDRRCTWYYSTYGRPNSLLSYEAVSFNAGVGSTSLVERRAEWDRAFAQMPRGSIRAGFHSDASRLYVANLNHFGRAGGFDALLSRMDLNKAEGLASLEEVATYVGVLAQGSRFFVPAWTEGYFERVRRLVFGRLERLSNDELGGDDETVALVVKHMEVVLPTVLRDFNAAETVERFHLSFALQLLRCPLLNPRIRGVTLLSDIIDNTVRSSARRKSKSKGNTGMGTNVGYAYEWLDEEFLARWLHDENVVEAVLGDPNPSGTTSSSGGDPSKDNADEASKKVHDTHVEVLKRADGLLGFMAHHDLLEAEHLDRLWDAGRGQPDAQVRAVFRLVEHICPRLGPAGLSVLYRHLRDLPRNYEEMHVELIRQFAESASRWGARGVSASPEREVSSGSSSQSIFGQGLELLWASIRDEAPVTAEVADQASEALADLLCHPFGPGRGYGYNNTAPAGSRLQSGMGYLGGGGGAGNAAAAAAASEAELHAHRLMFFLDMCLENVEKGLSVAPSLRLMQRIIDAQPVSSAALGKPSGRRNASGGAAGISGEGVAGMRKDEILVTLDEHKGLLRRLVEELLRYRRKARPAAQEAGLLSNPDDRAAGDTGAGGAAGDPLAAKLLGARLSHGEALGIRLDFIRFAVSHSPLELTFGLVETLWRDFLADPLCDSETEVFFAWMQSATPLPRPPQGGPAFVTMSSQVVHEVFRRLLCQEGGIPFDTMGPKGFWCLWRYFTVVNSEALAGSFAQKHHVMVEDFSSIQGLDTLWEAFLRSKNPAVVADAGDLLVQLHLRLAVQADEPRVWDSFIDRCMLTFESALHQVDQRTASHDVLASERVLRLLIKFLDEIDRPRGGGSYNSTSSNSSDGLILKVVVRGVRNSNGAQTIREFNWALLKRSVTVGELRARISREMGHPANQVRVINSQRQLCPSPDFDSLLLEMAPIFSYCDAVLLERPEDDTRGYVASVRRPETAVAS